MNNDVRYSSSVYEITVRFLQLQSTEKITFNTYKEAKKHANGLKERHDSVQIVSIKEVKVYKTGG